MNNAELSILILSGQHADSAPLTDLLTASGYRDVTCVDLTKLLQSPISHYRPGLLIINSHQISLELNAAIKVLIDAHRCPALLISRQHLDAHSLTLAMEQGICTYQGFEHLPASLTPVVDNALMQSAGYIKLQTELNQIQARLDDRKLIERAKGLLMKQHQCDEKAAYVALRKLSMDRAQNMGHIARELLQTLDS